MHTMKLPILLIFTIIFSITNSKEPKQIEIDLDFKEENNFFTVPITIGSGKKPQTFEVQIDTTTSETWVPSLNTTFDVPKYDPKKSKTSNVTRKTFEIDDEDGNVKGKATYDTLSIGENSLEKMGFVQVDEFELGFKDYNQGKLGLGFKQERGIYFDFIGNLKKNKIIDKAIFSILPDDQKLIIGDYPSDYEKESFTFCNLSETFDLDDAYRPGWVCELTHVFLGVNTDEKNLEMAVRVDARVIFDSGYKYISIPRRHLKDFNEKFMQEFFNDSCIEVKENHEIFFICDDDDKIESGNIAFVIGGYGYVVPYDKLFKKIEDDKYELLIRFPRENDDIFAFGYPFLSNFVTVYDAEENKVGFSGGEKIDLKKDWDEYMSGETSLQKKEKMKKLLIYGGIFGAILLLIILCILYRSKNPSESEARAMIHNEA